MADYFNLVNQAVEQMGWKAEQSVDLGLFSFQKLVIYKDLEANADLVTQHPIIRAIAGIKEENLILAGLPDEKDVDKIELPAQTYQVLDADSSQRVSIEYASARAKLRYERPTRHRKKPNNRKHNRRMHRSRKIRSLRQR